MFFESCEKQRAAYPFPLAQPTAWPMASEPLGLFNGSPLLSLSPKAESFSSLYTTNGVGLFSNSPTPLANPLDSCLSLLCGLDDQNLLENLLDFSPNECSGIFPCELTSPGDVCGAIPLASPSWSDCSLSAISPASLPNAAAHWSPQPPHAELLSVPLSNLLIDGPCHAVPSGRRQPVPYSTHSAQSSPLVRPHSLTAHPTAYLSPAIVQSNRTPTSGARRKLFDSDVVHVLRQWLNAHRAHPYPTLQEKKVLANTTGLTLDQINYWFINARRRYLRSLKGAAAKI